MAEMLPDFDNSAEAARAEFFDKVVLVHIEEI